MIKSMTGYGDALKEIDGKKISVEIKSVNHRYSDFNIKVSRTYSFLEEPIRRMLGEKISRGKVDVYVNIEHYGDQDNVVVINHSLAKGYLDAINEIGEKYNLNTEINAIQLSRYPDVFKVDKAEEDNEYMISVTLDVLSDALDGYNNMRIAEGEKLKEDMLSRLKVIEEAVEEIKKRSPQIVEEYKTRLETRMREILDGVDYDETRLLTEVGIFAERVDINEETVRLDSHIKQTREMLNSSGSIGRKLDFIIQEFNREINTIGSKSNDVEVAKIVIDVKSEIEKLREQAQNVE